MMQLPSIRKLLLTFSGLILLAEQCCSYKILVIPISSKSHVLATTVLSQELARRGHEVHMMLAATFKISPELAANDSKIHIQRFGSTDVEIDYEMLQDTVTGKILENQAGMGQIMEMLKSFVEGEAYQLLHNNEEIIARLEKVRFDIAIVDNLFFMKFLPLIPVRLGIPWVAYGDVLPFWNVRSPHLPSFVPSKMSAFTDRMSFMQRAINIFYTLVPHMYSFPDPPEEIIGKYRQYMDFKCTDDLISKSDLFIVTSDVVLDYPAPVMPNVVQVGGITVSPTIGRALPIDMEKFMASGKDGVILVTFGSMASQLPKRIASKFIDVFQKLESYRIIWRFSNKENLAVPNNVMLVNWLPQNDVLADPRVKLFITHSGNNGQFEAMYHAVPMIGFPIHTDQHFNAQRLKARGYGIPMNLHEFTAQELQDNIMKITRDGSYKQQISKASEIFRSARETPAARAAYWIEHVIRFGGDHLRSAGNELNFFQYFLIDVTIVLIIALLMVLIGIVLTLRCIIRKFFCKGDSSDDISNGKKNTRNIVKDGGIKKIN